MQESVKTQVTDILRSDDPNTLQRAASNPHESIWVGASAGTGKTKVLTDRVLRLLLPRSDGRGGTPPNRILCLTFTKAAANEMAQRINKTLGAWAVMELNHVEEKKSLTGALKNLLGTMPSQEQIDAAQKLFAQVIDCPGGLQIMTIHSFCQSVLGRFPLEADLPPGFEILEEHAAIEYMSKAQAEILRRAFSAEYTGSELSQAVLDLVHELDENSFSMLLREVCGERNQLRLILEGAGGVDGVHQKICDFYGVLSQQNISDIYELICDDRFIKANDLRDAAEAMVLDKGKNAPLYGRTIMTWLDADQVKRHELLDEYVATFIKPSDGLPRSQSFPPASARKICVQIDDILQKEAMRLSEAQNKIKAIQSARMTKNILLVGLAVLERYASLKAQRGLLDFDDLVLRTMALLRGDTNALNGIDRDSTQWIMYKLDQGLDHILVDEAQDTNPEQWRIIEALCEEFFNGFGSRDDVERTSFTVGDIKQSIYSFQRAAPEEFLRMQNVFHQKITESGQVNRAVGMDISFRSTRAVLGVVDQVFENRALREAVGGGAVSHQSFRSGQAGVVELWPCFETPKTEPRDFWDLPTVTRTQQSGSAQLASYIADKIRNWIDRKEILESCDRPVRAGDIMILVKSRGAIVDQLVREIKARGVPVSGADRMILSKQIAVQDMLSLARFCLLPEDDLTLAEVLKSPFLGWTEEELFSLAYNRRGSLWQELCNFDSGRIFNIPDKPDEMVVVSDEKRSKTWDYLARLSGRASYLGAYEFFSIILNQPCPADEISGLRAVRGRLGDDALDPIEEFMNAAMNFSREKIDHLQVFVQEQEMSETAIKREMEDQSDQVRIMTVHGSKGLQAPIVIMPDTMLGSSGKKGGRLLWSNKTGLDFPIYSPRGDSDPAKYKDMAQRAADLDEQEYYRLLYVAMTRAADRLYVAGYVGKNKAKEHSWYYQVKRAMEADPVCRVIAEDDANILRIADKQSAEPDQARDEKAGGKSKRVLPDWAKKMAPEEAFPPRPLIPSVLNEDEMVPALSPLLAGQENRFKRGNITHKLLQFLPDFDVENRENAARSFVRKNAAGLSKNLQESIVAEVMDVLNNPEFAPFFVKGSMAEVPVTGLMKDNRIISGQIDRLVVGKEDIWIVDYKTNRPPPKDPKDVPKIYRKQLEAYRDSIAEIYPDRKIHTALLWTDNSKLMIIDP